MKSKMILKLKEKKMQNLFTKQKNIQMGTLKNLDIENKRRIIFFLMPPKMVASPFVKGRAGRKNKNGYKNEIKNY
jgi:hypothetical protein